MINGLGPDFIQAFGRSSSVTIAIDSATLGPFALPRAGPAAQALADCVKDQLIEWGADPAQFEPGGATPVALVSRDDWVPNNVLIKMARGKDHLRAAFRVSVSVDGRIDACSLIDSTGGADVGKLACAAVLSKRLLSPATNRDGKPVRGVASFEVSLVSRIAR